VIEPNGGILVEKFITLPSVGGKEELRYKIMLDD
jgi:hypothetical protein